MKSEIEESNIKERGKEFPEDDVLESLKQLNLEQDNG